MSQDVRDQVMGHSEEADGIEEYDNPLPDWWLGMLWASIIWAVAYAAHYHFIAHRSQVKHLAAEMAEADRRWPQQSASAAALVITPATVESGHAIFLQNCVPCHGPNAEGGIGPNLTDTVWIHGETRADILHTITVGVLDKGMPPWGQMIGPEKVAQVAAYVIDHNGHVAN